MARLVVISKGVAALSHELGEHWVTIGRNDTNSFQIVETSVSGRHCEVRVKGDDLVVRDLQSTNGTFVAGQKISEGVLKPGQTLRLGEVELRLEASAAPGTSFVSKMLMTNAAPAKPPPPPVKAATAPETKPEAAGDPAKKFHVLFVDDSMAFLETFGGVCSVLSNGSWEIHSAPTADRALAILQDSPVDLVVLDIGIPMVDGIQLLGIITRRYPGMKIAVMTGNATEGNRATCLANGAELFIEKPVSDDGIRVVFNLLSDLVSWAHREGFTGALRHVGLQEVIQMECIGRHSSILEIRNSELRGQIYIEAGAITHAAVGPLTGDQAFHRLLSVKGGEFQLKPFKPPPQRTVQESWEFLLMDAARNLDEETAFLRRPKPAAPNPAPPGSAPAPAAEAAAKTPPPSQDDQHAALGDDIVVVATYDGKWKPVDGPQK
jgi:CheY-like chemotaxis protein